MNDTSCSRILLVEGTAGIGKSTLVESLIRRFVADHNRIRSFLHLSQAHTYGPLAPDEDNNSLTRDDNMLHIRDIIDKLKYFVSSLHNASDTRFYCIIETLHLTHCFRPGVLCWEDIKDFDKTISELGTKLVFLNASEDSIWKRCVWGRRKNGFITRYGKKFGNNLEEIHGYFVNEQNCLRELLPRTSMKHIQINVDSTIEEYLGKVYDFWLNEE